MILLYYIINIQCPDAISFSRLWIMFSVKIANKTRSCNLYPHDIYIVTEEKKNLDKENFL